MTEQEQVRAWNRVNPIGCTVDVRRDSGEILRTRTRSAAWLLGDHAAVILVEGIPGAYKLDRVTWVADAEREAAKASADETLEVMEWDGDNLFARTKNGKRIRFTGVQVQSFRMEMGN